ncbi:hypothetical protein LCGC14_2365420 [marine sediment metagenome]|uniref:Uncharacterized protein n=1 Tax=marine sediment metagenome TaxID=412755 RepID=A0A0F9C5L2_9ZZZZ
MARYVNMYSMVCYSMKTQRIGEQRLIRDDLLLEIDEAVEDAV